MEEEWRDIKDYEGKYQVSNLGRVKSLNYHRDNREQILNTNSDRYGYLKVILYKNGKGKSYTIHKLVAEAFIPNPNNYPIINHKDENKQNNRVDNLEWCTYQYNNTYGTRLERASKKISGAKSSTARKVECITTGIQFKTIKEASKYYKISNTHIGQCCKGERKSAGKYMGKKLKWKYID